MVYSIKRRQKKEHVALLLLFSFLLLQGSAQPPADQYQRKEEMIPMRDGIRLFTVILWPKTQKEALPFLLCRTPYGVRGVASPEKNQYVSELATEGYIFV